MAWLFDDEGPTSALSAAEAANALKQADQLRELIQRAVTEAEFRVTPAMLCELNGLAVDGLVDHPGVFRTDAGDIIGSRHVPPPAPDVPGYVDQLCAELHAGRMSGVALGAYALWRLNWIHPFEDGNGRTARALCYLVICRDAGYLLPGRVALPERIEGDKRRYYRCLEEADRANRRRGRPVNVSQMTGFLDRLMRCQLRDALLEASGRV